MWFNNNRMLYIYLHGNILLNFETSHCTVYPNSWFQIPNLFLMLPSSKISFSGTNKIVVLSIVFSLFSNKYLNMIINPHYYYFFFYQFKKDLEKKLVNYYFFFYF